MDPNDPNDPNDVDYDFYDPAALAAHYRLIASSARDPLAHLAEKLAWALVLTDMIRDDITLGRYGAVGRPNVQAVHHVLAFSDDELREHRADLDKCASERRAYGMSRVALPGHAGR